MRGPESPRRRVGRLGSVRAFSQTSRQRPRFRAWIELDRNWSRRSPIPRPRVTSTDWTGFFRKARRREATERDTRRPRREEIK